MQYILWYFLSSLYFLITTKNKDILTCPFFYKGCPLNMLILLFVVPVDLFLLKFCFFPHYIQAQCNVMKKQFLWAIIFNYVEKKNQMTIEIDDFLSRRKKTAKSIRSSSSTYLMCLFNVLLRTHLPPPHIR